MCVFRGSEEDCSESWKYSTRYVLSDVRYTWCWTWNILQPFHWEKATTTAGQDLRDTDPDLDDARGPLSSCYSAKSCAGDDAESIYPSPQRILLPSIGHGDGHDHGHDHGHGGCSLAGVISRRRL